MYLRFLGSFAVLVSAVVHLQMWFDGVRHQHVIGPAFLLNAVGGAVIAVLLVTWAHWVPPLLTLGFGVATLGAFTLAASVGLFGVHEHWAGAHVWTAAVSEAVAIVVGAVLVSRANPLLGRSPRQAEHRSALGRLHLH